MSRLPFIPVFRQNSFRIYSIFNLFTMRLVAVRGIYGSLFLGFMRRGLVL
jgi:hypothetical protein